MQQKTTYQKSTGGSPVSGRGDSFYNFFEILQNKILKGHKLDGLKIKDQMIFDCRFRSQIINHVIANFKSIMMANHILPKFKPNPTYASGAKGAILLLLFTLPLYSQITTSSILASAKSDPIFVLKNEEAALLKQNPLILPGWEEIEFRPRVTGFDIQDSDYAFRFKRTPRKQIRQQKRVYESMLQIADNETVAAYMDVLEDRYNALVSNYYLNEELKSKTKMMEILEDKKRIIQNTLAVSESPELNDLIKIEADIREEKMEIAEMEFLQKQYQQKLDKWKGNSTKVVWDDWISIAKVKEVINELRAQNIFNHPDWLRRQSQTGFALNEEKLKAKEAGQIFKFFQVRYAHNPKDSYRERLSVSMSMRLTNPKKPSLREQEQHLETLQFQKNAEITKAELEQSFHRILKKLDFLTYQYELLQKQIEQEKELLYYQDLFAQYAIDVQTYTQILISKAKDRATLKRIEADIFEMYLEALSLSGKLVELPMRNYLSEELEGF